MLTEIDRVSHILRRFGLGAGSVELEKYKGLSPEAVLEKLLDFESVDEGFPVSPWEFCFDPNNEMFYFDPPRIAEWWSLRLLLTQRPLQEKLTLFWHNHFAVSAVKVEFGPMMLQYNQTLRKYGAGKFGDLLMAMAKDPAMMFFLDTPASVKGHPNENFAREVMELFTLGIGNYTEKDIQEAARCFTGWGLRYLIYESGGEKVQEISKQCAKRELPMVAYCFTPDLHDDGEKTIFGQSGKFNGEDVIRILASRRETALRISKKLWEFFAYENPEAAVVEKLADVFVSTQGDTRSMLRAMAGLPEFWSEKCIRSVVKSPFDFTVALGRQFGLNTIVLQMRAANTPPMTPAPKGLRDSAGLIFGTMYQQGMILLYPPDVGGWKGGKQWISSSSMLQRTKMGDLLFGMGTNDHPLAAYLAALMVAEKIEQSPDAIVTWLCRRFDANPGADQFEVMKQACSKAGGYQALSKPESAAQALSSVCRLMFASPQFQFC